VDADVTDLLEITKELSAFKSKASRSLGRAWRTTQNCRKALQGIKESGQASEQEIQDLEKALLCQTALFLNINYRLWRRLKALSWNPDFVKLADKYKLPRINRGNLRWIEVPDDLTAAADNFSDEEQNHGEM
jgi:hypothetical protein